VKRQFGLFVNPMLEDIIETLRSCGYVNTVCGIILYPFQGQAFQVSIVFLRITWWWWRFYRRLIGYVMHCGKEQIY